MLYRYLGMRYVCSFLYIKVSRGRWVSSLGSRRLDEHSLLHVCSMISFHGWISDAG